MASNKSTAVAVAAVAAAAVAGVVYWKSSQQKAGCAAGVKCCAETASSKEAQDTPQAVSEVAPGVSSPTAHFVDAGGKHRKTFKEYVSCLRVVEVELPPVLQSFVESYGRWGRRNPFLWKWLYYGTQLMELPTVLPEHHEDVTLIKSLLNFLNVVTDDIGDEESNIKLLHNIETDFFAGSDFDPEGDTRQSETRRRSMSGTTQQQQLAFCQSLRETVWTLARKLPRYEEFKLFLEYDIRQMLNEKRFSALMNLNPAFMNCTEHFMYAPHTMHGMIFLTTDLMASPSVNIDEVGVLRAAFWDANIMANVSNCLGTWPREVPKRDWSAPLFSVALDTGLVTPEQLRTAPSEQIGETIKASDLEDRLLSRWYDSFEHFQALGERVQSFSLKQFNEQNRAFLAIHLASRGHI